MAKTRKQKEEEIAFLQDRLADSKCVVMVGYQGIGVNEIQELKRNFKEVNVLYRVAKKSLFRKALQKIGLAEEVKVSDFKKPVAFAFSQDETSAPKKISEFAKENNKLEILGGIMDKEFIDADVMQHLAKLPDRDVLLSQCLFVINSPISGFVNVLRSNIQSLVFVLNNIKAEKEKA
ncbi:50S ribosomal protein L10 [bacterium (Candidatus Torokbacteria) CG_4_10_14_0_2_um_filter_35_8]|nr:MAG: 50S ribosomal protein L10 [bacterium (Candidatus Torokbacteria) CG_4_10_14_0_2_um_filter_35_8]